MMLDIGKVKKIGLFASGVLFGTAGVKVLGSKDAKKFYINCLAAGLRAIQENAEDILAEAKEINEQRNKEEVFEDESQAEESFKEEEAATAEA